MKQALFTELWTVFEQIPGEFADFLAGTLTGPEQIGQTFFSCYQITTKKCLGISFSSGSDPLLFISGKEAISSFSSRVKPVLSRKPQPKHAEDPSLISQREVD
ncbi:hypothetical protein OM428_11915 [Enterococcus gallinarum]|nr:hypothetical protein [Enterococcus gallinarum]